MRSNDWIVVILVFVVFLIWGWVRFRYWFENPPKKPRFSVPLGDGAVEPNEVTELLEGAGFDVLAAKTRVPIVMTLNDRETFQSRLYVDYFVEKNEEVYIVKVARDRRPLELTGSGVRDALLPYYLLYPETSGVLYVDMETSKIKKFTFDIEV
jgi:hypothetical protein